MNKEPDTTGISRYWKAGEDARVDIHAVCHVEPDVIDGVISALQKVVTSRKRTKIVGFGVFEWKPWRNRIPTGRFVETWRLSFKPCRYAGKYTEKKHGHR